MKDSVWSLLGWGPSFPGGQNPRHDWKHYFPFHYVSGQWKLLYPFWTPNAEGLCEQGVRYGHSAVNLNIFLRYFVRDDDWYCSPMSSFGWSKQECQRIVRKSNAKRWNINDFITWKGIPIKGAFCLHIEIKFIYNERIWQMLSTAPSKREHVYAVMTISKDTNDEYF